jgi:hypothetical protein
MIAESKRIELQAVMDQRFRCRFTYRLDEEWRITLPIMRDIIGGVTVATAATLKCLIHGRFALALDTLKQHLLAR